MTAMNSTQSTANAKTHLEKILSLLEIEASVSEESFDQSTVCYRIDCSEEDAKVLIGRKGQTLEAMQFLVRQMCRAVEGEEEHFVLDVLDYRQRRKDSIIEKAKRAAVAVLNGEEEEYALPPMSAFERRIVHNYLHEHFPDLSSASDGQGTDRHIVISYSGPPDRDDQAGEIQEVEQELS